ncbi:hypothetical protein SCLCIDRAFT_1217603, partial [Scleroderma citrinum Foug A]
DAPRTASAKGLLYTPEHHRNTLHMSHYDLSMGLVKRGKDRQEMHEYWGELCPLVSAATQCRRSLIYD